jgi:L-alanine-DL-glutamate epimerase-like enolase superfamily enzyme
MKITNVRAVPVRIPIPHPLYLSEGAGSKIDWGRRSRVSPKRPTPILEYVLVELETDGGVRGIGEAPVDIGFFGDTLEQTVAAVDDYLGPQLVGRSIFDRERLFDTIDYRHNTCARSGIDLAVHDAIGRALHVPVSHLIGGRCRERVQVAIEIAGGTPDDMAAACVAFMEKGVRAFKPKIGGYPEQDAERLRVIRTAVGPDVSLRADANQGYSPKEAIRLCRLAEKYDVGLDLLEQPVRVGDLKNMALVRRSVDTLIEADESCFSLEDAMQIVRHEAADVLNIKLPKAGGFHFAKKIAALAEAAGLQVVLGTGFGLGAEIAAKLHLAASTLAVVDAVEFTEIGLHANLLAAPHDRELALPLEDGCLGVPTGDGLGVTFDDEAISRHRLPE